MIFVFLASFFLGVCFLWYEKKNWIKNVTQIQNEAHNILKNSLNEQEYIQKIDIFLQNNGFLLEKNINGLFASQKLFSIGVFLIGFSFIIGALIYIIYFKFFALRKMIALPHYQKGLS